MLQCRGRSRQVADSALARQASEERRFTTTTTTLTTATYTTNTHSPSHRKLFLRTTVSVSTERYHSMPKSTDSSDLAHIIAPVPMKSTLPPHFIRSASPSPPSSASMSPDYYDSPPSPPQSLEDQLHVAYAHDDIHLAKILLLRLKGIDITSDDDPRIAAVQDEDFDFCFVPNGRLMDENDEKEMKEKQRIERERIEEKLREERLRACERIWAVEKRRLREERTIVLRKKEVKRVQEEVRKKQRDQEEKARVLEAERCQMRTRHRSEKRVVSYDFLQQRLREADESHLFVYDVMPLTTSRVRKQPVSCSPPSSISNSRYHFPAHTFDDSRSISFIDVLKSMQGPLFPLLDEERTPRNDSPTHASPRSSSCTHSQVRRRRELELLQTLLIEVEFNEEERRKHLKGKMKVAPWTRRATCCPSCRVSSSPASSPVSPTTPDFSSISSSSSSSSGSRPSSWLSFRSSMSSISSASSSSSLASSASADAIAASDSPILTSSKPSWFKSTSVPTFASRRSSWISTLTLPSPLTPPSTTAESPISSPDPTTCTCHPKMLTRVAVEEGPLSLHLPSTAGPYSTTLETLRDTLRTQRHRLRSLRSTKAADTAGVLVKKMSSQFLELAKGFHNAYVATAMFSVVASLDCYEDSGIGSGYEVMEKNQQLIEQTAMDGEMKWKGRLRPAGRRVSPDDVTVFLDARLRSSSHGTAFDSCLHSSSSDITNSTGGRAAKLLARSRSKSPSAFSLRSSADFDASSAKYIPLGSPYPAQPPHSTALPNPLPYKLVFKPIPPPTRSPFRFNAFSHLHTTYPSAEQVSPPYVQPEQSGISTYNTLTGVGYSSTSNGGVSWRIRSVSNPVHLRLKALQNLVWRRGGVWEGKGREMGLGGGRDRVVGVAYEGIGRSRLGVCAQ